MRNAIVVVNAGSTSVKFGLFEDVSLRAIHRGAVTAIGPHAKWRVDDDEQDVLATDLEEAIDHLYAWVQAQANALTITHVVNRVVHGGDLFVAPAPLDPQTYAALNQLTPLAPLHQSANLLAAHRLQGLFPEASHLACFDTAFHATMPRLQKSFALPPEWFEKGVRRYGFHGLSYEWIAHRLAQDRPDLLAGRVVAAHLGGGASLCALREGRSVATTMGMTAIDGVPMATRSGAIDPGAVLYLARQAHLGLAGVEGLLSGGAGLKGLSGISGDVRDLRSSPTERAKFALTYFAERVAQAAAALTVPLGGVDAIVFSGGIGANDGLMRDDIMQRLKHLGACEALVIDTDEEWIMARHATAWKGRAH